ncbi:MAG: DUF4416 family protein [Thermodesulfobacteriota bacterium]
MGQGRVPKPAKLFMSLITSSDKFIEQGIEALCLDFGPIDFISERLPFYYTDYYTAEMGSGLFRRLITFESLIPRERLPEIKKLTNRLEERMAKPDGRRQINIDPGYLCLEHVILATTKGYTHRPYLRDGIYADLTLIFRNKSYHPLEWTYPDYREGNMIKLFNQFRKVYLQNLKEKEDNPC